MSDLLGMNCEAQFKLGYFAYVTRVRERRFVAVDRERGAQSLWGDWLAEHHVDAGGNHRGEGREIVRRGPEGGDDLGGVVGHGESKGSGKSKDCHTPRVTIDALEALKAAGFAKHGPRNQTVALAFHPAIAT